MSSSPRRHASQVLKSGFAGRLVKARLDSGKTQVRMAELLGVPYRSYQRMESGERVPEPGDLKLVAEHFGWSMPELLVECGYLDAPPEVPPIPVEPYLASGVTSPMEQTFSTVLGPVKVEVIIRVSRA